MSHQAIRWAEVHTICLPFIIILSNILFTNGLICSAKRSREWMGERGKNAQTSEIYVNTRVSECVTVITFIFELGPPPGISEFCCVDTVIAI